ncbi:hypothetical protein LTS12_022052 [Elasticomyces elasticus]|nr:hypothetical protein LTS12_022052 [Elasticomyces elasticus]
MSDNTLILLDAVATKLRALDRCIRLDTISEEALAQTAEDGRARGRAGARRLDSREPRSRQLQRGAPTQRLEYDLSELPVKHEPHIADKELYLVLEEERQASRDNDIQAPWVERVPSSDLTLHL